MFAGILILALLLITLKSGVSGCLTFVIISILAMTAGIILFKENGLIYAVLFSIGLAVYQIFKKKEIT